MNAKLAENGSTRVYIKIEQHLKPDWKGLLGPTTSRNTRFVFGQPKSKGNFWELGEIDLATGELLNQGKHGPENTRDAQIVIDAISHA